MPVNSWCATCNDRADADFLSRVFSMTIQKSQLFLPRPQHLMAWLTRDHAHHWLERWNFTIFLSNRPAYHGDHWPAFKVQHDNSAFVIIHQHSVHHDHCPTCSPSNTTVGQYYHVGHVLIAHYTRLAHGPESVTSACRLTVRVGVRHSTADKRRANVLSVWQQQTQVLCHNSVFLVRHWCMFLWWCMLLTHA